MKTYTTYTDEQLFSLVRTGDNKAFDVLYERFFPILYIHACRKLTDVQDAKDIVQETFISLYQKKSAIGEIKNFAVYIYVLLKNNILNFLEKSDVRQRYRRTFFFEEQYAPVENYIFEKELRQQIEEGVKDLPPKMRAVFELSRYENLSHKEIGDQLKISDKTVKRQIANALKIIKSKIHLLFF